MAADAAKSLVMGERIVHQAIEQGIGNVVQYRVDAASRQSRFAGIHEVSTTGVAGLCSRPYAHPAANAH